MNPFSLYQNLLSLLDVGSCVLKSPSILNGARPANSSMSVCRASIVSIYWDSLSLSPSKNGRYAQQTMCDSLSFLSYIPAATIRSDAVLISFMVKFLLFSLS